MARPRVVFLSGGSVIAMEFAVQALVSALVGMVHTRTKIPHFDRMEIAMGRQKHKKSAPKLPRFKVPKKMSSLVFLSRKEKMNSRQNLKRELRNELGY